MRLPTQDELNRELAEYMRVGILNNVSFYDSVIVKWPDVKSIVPSRIDAKLLYDVLSYRIAEDRKNSGLTRGVAFANVSPPGLTHA